MPRLQGWLSFTLLLVCASLSMWAQQSGDNTFVPPLVKFSGVLVDSAGKPITGMVGVTLLRPLRSLIESVEREKTTYEPRHLKGD